MKPPPKDTPTNQDFAALVRKHYYTGPAEQVLPPVDLNLMYAAVTVVMEAWCREADKEDGVDWDRFTAIYNARCEFSAREVVNALSIIMEAHEP